MELGKIETILAQHPDVREAAVIYREEETSNQSLIAYIVSELIPERLPYHRPCLVEFEDKTITLYTEDISYNGFCLIDVPPSLIKGKVVRLRILLPSETEERWLKGAIVWCQGQKAGIQLSLTPFEQLLVHRSVDYILETQGFLKVLQRIITGRLRQYLNQHLPDSPLPDTFVILQSLPLMPDGQINRQALPTPETNSWIG
jgi:acyl-CoA synthetase (AMP-forming)/AMP-acid ligase II